MLIMEIDMKVIIKMVTLKEKQLFIIKIEIEKWEIGKMGRK